MDEAYVATIMLIIFGWCSYFIQGDRDYIVKQQRVYDITYKYTQIATKKGKLSNVIMDELESKLNIYGEFEIELVAEKFEGNNTITRLEGTQIIDFDLRDNDFDIITIYVKAKKEHYLSKIFQLPPMGRTDVSYRLIAQSSAYIQ